jgi:CRP-like cAMP-binding protein
MGVKNTETLLENFASANGFTEGFPAFAPVLSECVHFLGTLPAARSIAAGTLLVEQGRVHSSIQLIETGLVKLVHVSADGREITIGLRSEGWYAGYTSVFLKTSQAYSVRTVTPCKIVSIPAADFSRCLAQSAEMLQHFLSVLCAEVASQASLQVEVMSSNAEDRLEHFMLERATGHPSRKTLDPLPLLKQMEVAQLLAVTPEHLSRLMNRRKLLGSKPATQDSPWDRAKTRKMRGKTDRLRREA